MHAVAAWDGRESAPQNLGDESWQVVPFKGALEGRHLIQNAPEAPHVAHSVVWLVLTNLCTRNHT